MLSEILIGLLVVVIAFIAREELYPLIYHHQARRRNLNPVKVHRSFPLGIPLILDIISRIKTGSFLELQLELREKFGTTFLSENVGRWFITTTDPENIKTVLSTNFNDYSIGTRQFTVAIAFGHGIFTLNGEGWKHSRAMLRPQFSREQVSQLNSVQAHVDTLIKVILEKQKTQPFLDMQELFHELTMDTASEFLLGESVRSLIQSEHVHVTTSEGERIGPKEFVQTYTFLVNFTRDKILMGKFHYLKDSAEYRAHIRKAQAFIDYFVQKALDATELNEKESTGTSYIFSHELAKVTRDPVVIRDQILNVLIAARDTTAVTMTMIVYFLSVRPELFAELRDEILETFPDGVPITFEKLRQAKLLNMVINETLRHCPVVPQNARLSVKDTVLPRGGGPNQDKPIFVPKGSVVLYSVFAMHRDKDLWGEDALDFRPSRWADGAPRHWAYLPFNGGPRICLGQQFALTEVALTTVKLLKHFNRLEPSPSLSRDPKYTVSMTLRALGTVDIRFHTAGQ